MKIGFIGCGNMATAIINGITNNNVVSEKDINAYDIFDVATKKLKNPHKPRLDSILSA